MSDVIKLLPDAVANQIAAGEVIQRPASVIKELVENAVDAGGTKISIHLRDAGRTSIQVIDNGNGMSATDARLSFERHATSKIRDARDLFSIRTLGFRGEALASVAAVAEVKLRTKKPDDELGSEVDIAATQIISQVPVSCPDGSNFLVRNLFFNTPARRKFLKSDPTELRHIINEFQRVALTHPEIEFSLHHNNLEIYNLPFSNFRQRICNVFGKSLNSNLIPLNADTSIVKVSGLLGKPEIARKSPGEQFFFVNHRYIRHPFLHRAVMKAYEQLLPSSEIPLYFIYLEIDPEAIDINIHPTKTEVKFEDEQSIFQILLSSVKEALGKFNIVPSLDFDIDRSVEIPVYRSSEEVRQPTISINPNYNPFNQSNSSGGYERSQHDRENLANWENLYAGLENRNEDAVQTALQMESSVRANSATEETPNTNTFQLKNRYILTSVKSGLMVIDQKRAHERILFERYLNVMQNFQIASQQCLFPDTIEFSQLEMDCLREIDEDIRTLGFDLEFTDETHVLLKGYPQDAANNATNLLRDIVTSLLNEEMGLSAERSECIAREMAKAAAVPYGKTLSPQEMHEIVDMLFACSMPNYSPTGKPVLNIINLDEIEQRLA